MGTAFLFWERTDAVPFVPEIAPWFCGNGFMA
jgi:hypothetical protein